MGMPEALEEDSDDGLGVGRVGAEEGVEGTGADEVEDFLPSSVGGTDCS